LRHVVKRIKACAPDVVHGHGSKGGVYARLGAKLAGGQAASAYTPHGGSFNYRPGTLAHHVFMMIEGALRPLTDIYLFESAFMARKMREEVGPARALQRVVLNGLSDAEFQPVAPAPDAGDFLYIGELRSVKGIDTMLEALAKLHARTALRPTLTIVGTGPDEALLKGQAETLGLSPYVTFAGAMNAREAFSRARAMIVPSRAESLPYVVLEAAAARLPLLSTNVGGIGEIFGPESHRLFPPGDAELLAERMSATLRAPAEELSAQSQALFDHVRGHFSIADMADQALAGYRDAIAAKAYRASQISPPSSGAISFSPKA
jgi:glycosyltransferase involved in cell wall biosynthesis